MSEMKSTVQTPFQNLKFIAMINKIMGLLSCKLVNGRLKPSAWGRFYCALWILIHCTYSALYYYDKYNVLLKEKAIKYIIFDIVRFTVFIISLIPYNCVAVFQEQDFIKFSDKLETYDDKARALGHERKDKHKLIWLYFVLTTIDLIRKTYDAINESISEGTMAIVKKVFDEVVPFIIGTYCILLTGTFLHLIGQRFRHLNETIIPHVSQLPVTGSPGEITVYDVRYLHNVLLDSAAQINSFYGIAIFFCSLSFLLEFVKNIYELVVDGIHEDEIITILDLLFQAVFLFGMYQFVTYEVNMKSFAIKYFL
ncbi:uncharacterized protein LOC126855724 [Cataglyphis hispanica]|uniref:uncharacterized protein LOC126855724 n=1 Tax=Cataglyphis hispanica TaxID=1086592 RepID=UPI00217FB499|nr:uncharacterized protein LOC126855724 [Cataglyphis hispanica]